MPTSLLTKTPSRSSWPAPVWTWRLRDAINIIRLTCGLGDFAWTDLVLIPGITPINAIHLTELRTALNDAYRCRVDSTYLHRFPRSDGADHQSHPPERAPLQRPRVPVRCRPGLRVSLPRPQRHCRKLITST